MSNLPCIYPNQKIITVHKAPFDKNHIYSCFNKEALFAACRGLKGNELKAFLYLSSNQKEYRMALSTSDMAEKLGSTEDGMRTAIRGLIEKGYMEQESGNLYGFYEEPTLKSTKSASEKTPKATGKSSVCNAETSGEIIQKEYKKNTTKYKSDRSEELSYEWKEVFRSINVTPNKNSITRIEKAIGKVPEAGVLRRLISYNRKAFDKGMEQKEGYRFNTLLNLVKEQYDKWERVIASEEIQRQWEEEERRRQPRIDYNQIYREEPKKEGLDDISELLDEMFDCEELEQEQSGMTMLELLAKMKAEKEAAEEDDLEL